MELDENNVVHIYDLNDQSTYTNKINDWFGKI